MFRFQRTNQSAEQYLSERQFCRRRSRGDGHCLIYSIQTSLKGQLNRALCKEDIFQRCRFELIRNQDKYTSYFTGKDLVLQFDRYYQNREYNLQIVDIVLKVLANSLGINIIVADVKNNRVIETTFSSEGPAMSSGNATVYVFRDGDHFDGLEVESDDSERSLITMSSESSDNLDDNMWGDVEPGVTQNERGTFKYSCAQHQVHNTIVIIRRTTTTNNYTKKNNNNSNSNNSNNNNKRKSYKHTNTNNNNKNNIHMTNNTS